MALIQYWRLWRAFFSNCLSREMEYRGHLAAGFMVDVAWYGTQIAMFSVLYRFTPTVGGLDSSAMTLFLATLFIVDALNMMLVSSNFWRFPHFVMSGELDFYLIKPVAPLFYVFFRYINLASVFNLVLGIALLIYGVVHAPMAVPIERWVLYGMLIGVGWTVGFALQVIVASLSVLVVNAEGIQMLHYALYQFAMKPDSIYARPLRRIFLTVFPMALVASVPAHVLYGEPNGYLIVSSIGIAIVFMVAASRFFRWTLTRYSGASS